jgi:hypothetical protein
VKSQIDHGKKLSKMLETDEDSSQIITKLRGELFSRINATALAKFLEDGQPHYIRTNSFLFDQEILRSGKHPPQMPVNENEGPKILLLDLRPE